MNLKPVNLSYKRRCIDLIILFWCQMISCNIAQVFISELGYTIDYVMIRKGNINSSIFSYGGNGDNNSIINDRKNQDSSL